MNLWDEARPEPELEEIQGTVTVVIFTSADNNFTVFRIRPEQQQGQVCVTANATSPLVGQKVKLAGSWVEHPRFGHQFKALRMEKLEANTAAGIERFLASGAVAGIGPAMAKRLVKHFGDKTLKIIERHPERLLEIAGIGRKTMKKIHESYGEQSELREIILWLESHGISGSYAGKIFEEYSSFAMDVLNNHPYRLARDISGIGFLTADTIAKANGIDQNSVERIEAGLDYTLMQAAQSGHCCLPAQELANRTVGLLQSPPDLVRQVLQQQLKLNRLVETAVGGNSLIYAKYLYRAEQETAERLLDLEKKAEDFHISSVEDFVSEWESYSGVDLADGQREAVIAALQHGVFVLTGGPGTGKTTVIRSMLELLEQQGLEILLGAPTGRAAKRLSEATGRKAATVHRMLEAQGGDGGMVFGRDDDEQLEADVIILDEVSMMDIVLMQHFLQALPDGCHVILVGDVDQLPAVGPGSVLKDILRSGVIPSRRLTEIFRQDENSRIVSNAHAINQGRLPVSGADFTIVSIDDELTAASEVLRYCTQVVEQWGYSPTKDVQVLSPMHRQTCGVDNLNRLLQEALNPPDAFIQEIKQGAQTFREGDKVMQTRNNYQKEVFNGDIGFIEEINGGLVRVKYNDEDLVEYSGTELQELQLAYAMSVHKSQGSEYPVIILVLMPSQRIMLQRNLLYTAVTRARQRVVLIATRAVLNTAVNNDRTQRRNTLLAERLAQVLLE